MFGDVGSGQIGEDGQSYVWLDPMLTQVISGEYQVFLQGYADALFYVSERSAERFVVQGPPGLGLTGRLRQNRQVMSRSVLTDGTGKRSGRRDVGNLWY